MKTIFGRKNFSVIEDQGNVRGAGNQDVAAQRRCAKNTTEGNELAMLQLTMYGLVGLAAMLIIAFYFACGDEFPSVRENPSLHSTDFDSQMDRGQTKACRG